MCRAIWMRTVSCGLILVLDLTAVSAPAMELATGSFVGSGTADRAITGVGFQPDVVIVHNASTIWGEPVIRTSTTTGGRKIISSDLALSTGMITSLDANGFTMNSGQRTNENGTRFHYVAWRERLGARVGTFASDGVAGDLAVTVPFQPDVVGATRVPCCVKTRHRPGYASDGRELFLVQSSRHDGRDQELFAEWFRRRGRRGHKPGIDALLCSLGIDS